ncbi:MAG: glucose 1-dehydrogenase [Chloroflexi bacterium]|nr:glucose 1-dehydrogenase [Chloroflexota bacterium]
MSLQVDLRGRRAIVTGGGRGIGRAIVLGLARNGADVAVVYRQDGASADATAAAARDFGVRAITIQASIGDGASSRDVVERVVAELGGVEILVNNAGVMTRIPFLELPEEEWRRVLGTNLDGNFLMGQAVARQMVASGTRGAIVNITSVNQTICSPNLAHYVVSKAGALALTRQMAFELAPYGIRVNAVAPGLTETDINRKDLADPAFREMRLGRIPLHRMADTDDHANAVVFLVSDAAKYVTGEFISPDGGATLIGPNPLPMQIEV